MTDNIFKSPTGEWLVTGRGPDAERVLGEVLDAIKKTTSVTIVHVTGPEAAPRRAIIRTTPDIQADLQATFGDRVLFAPNVPLKLM